MWSLQSRWSSPWSGHQPSPGEGSQATWCAIPKPGDKLCTLDPSQIYQRESVKWNNLPTLEIMVGYQEKTEVDVWNLAKLG